jgi:hypothetical protein
VVAPADNTGLPVWQVSVPTESDHARRRSAHTHTKLRHRGSAMASTVFNNMRGPLHRQIAWLRVSAARSPSASQPPSSVSQLSNAGKRVCHVRVHAPTSEVFFHPSGSHACITRACTSTRHSAAAAAAAADPPQHGATGTTHAPCTGPHQAVRPVSTTYVQLTGSAAQQPLCSAAANTPAGQRSCHSCHAAASTTQMSVQRLQHSLLTRPSSFTRTRTRPLLQRARCGTAARQ